MCLSRQQVLKWVLKEPSVLRLVSNPVCSVYMQGTGCGCLCAAAKCQTMCVSKYAQGKVKTKRKMPTSTPTYLFHVGDCVYTVCVCLCVCCVGVCASGDTSDWRLFDWQPNLCLFLSADLFVLFFCFKHTSK